MHVDLQPKAPPSAGNLASYDATRRGGNSTTSFLLWLANSQYSYAWHLEEDVFFTGPWHNLVADARWGTHDLVASFIDRSWDEEWTVRQQTVISKCLLRRELECQSRLPDAAQQFFGPLARMSRAFAQNLSHALQHDGAMGFSELLTSSFCRASAWCTMEQLSSRSIGIYALGGPLTEAATCGGPCVDDLPEALSCKLYHPVKCSKQGQERSGILALEYASSAGS